MEWHQQSFKLPLKSEMEDDTQATTPLKLYQPYEECSCKPSLQTKDGLESTTQSQIYVLHQLWDLKGMQWQQEKPFLLLLAELTPGEAHGCPSPAGSAPSLQQCRWCSSTCHICRQILLLGTAKKCSAVINCASSQLPPVVHCVTHPHHHRQIQSRL